MDKRELTFFIPTMIVCAIAGIFICSVSHFIGIPYPIALFISLLSGFAIGFTGRMLYTKYK